MNEATNYLLEALALAELRRGFCAPNPAVGAVIVKDKQLLATGYHEGVGSPHAEVVALQKLNLEITVGATLYVTLEPCCHYGRTPPCTDLIIKHKIKHVVYGYRDPNPQVSGQGVAALKNAGIVCELVELPAIAIFYQSYAFWWQYKRPWVTLKLAISLDSKIAAADGQPVAITGPELQRYTHQWRYRSDAILTTATTLLADNPRLNVRLDDQIYPKPIYVLDSNLKTPLSSVLFTTASQISLFYQAETVPERLNIIQQRGVNCVPIPVDSVQHGLSLNAIMHYLGNQGLHDLWVEAGGVCFSALLEAKLVQRVLIYIAPTLLGQAARPAFYLPKDYFASANRVNWQPMGNDVVLELLF